MQRSKRRLVRLSAVVLVLIGVAVGSAWRLAAQKSATPVRPLDHRQHVGFVAVGNRGATYHELERQAFRTTTRFVDGSVVAERAADGRIKARVADRDGHEVATLSVDDALAFAAGGSPERRFERHATVQPTLDWANQQAHAFLRDGAAADLEWQGVLARPAGSTRSLDEPLEIRTESNGGFVAEARRQKASPPIAGEMFVSRILKDGARVGTSTWYVRDQILVWSFPGLTAGSLSAKELAIVGGAWPFKPDLEWVNTQNLAFYRFHTLVNEKARIARQSSALARFVAFLVPTLRADEPGCDGLHWLDNTIFRPCCDIHDQCYYAVGCSSWSWWWGSAWPSGWQCLGCNAVAVGCFGSIGANWPYVEHQM